MTVSRIQAILVALVVTIAVASPLAAQEYEVSDQGASSLFAQGVFANYYTADGASQTAAQLYPAPYPVPSRVGATYYTYQPLYPHEHLYPHTRVYYNYYAGPEAFYTNPNNGHDWPN